jgi:hypothetical protein
MQTLQKEIYIYLGLITFSALTFEVVLTRVFSVTMWYHFAFMATSSALFGLTIGSLIVHFGYQKLFAHNTRLWLQIFGTGLSLSLILSLLLISNIPLVFDGSLLQSILLVVTFGTAGIPFVFDGLILNLIFEKWGQFSGKLYAVDLFFSSIGALVTIAFLEFLDPLTIAVALATLVLIGTLLVLPKNVSPKPTLGLAGILILLTIGNWYLGTQNVSVFKLTSVKGREEPALLKEVWNSYSRLSVFGNLSMATNPFTWGLSPSYTKNEQIPWLYLAIDGDAGTPLTQFDGDTSKHEYLRYDLINFTYHLTTQPKTLIIGAGGGRDVLSALSFGASHITALEMNHDISKLTTDTYREFTGNLAQKENIDWITTEARSWLANSTQKFDLIQLSFIDTWAATSAGGLSLTENSLYTVESWQNTLAHLSQKGIFTVSRWYDDKNPAEIYRLANLAKESIALEYETSTPDQHIVLLTLPAYLNQSSTPFGIGTILVSRSPFTSDQLSAIENLSQKFDFTILYAPKYSDNDPNLSQILVTNDFDPNYPFDISPPTDDKPFFFQTAKISTILQNTNLWDQKTPNRANNQAIFNILTLFGLVLILGIGTILIPLIIDKKLWKFPTLSYMIYFVALGMGFMLIEIGIMQQLSIFLGHPVFGLAVILFTLLLAGGIGSLVSSFISIHSLPKLITLLLITQLIYLTQVPTLLNDLSNWNLALKIISSIGVLFPLGFFMGMPFSLGLRKLHQTHESLTAWMFGINGIFSVLASVLAVVISLIWGIQTTLMVGIAFYVLAFLVSLLKE